MPLYDFKCEKGHIFERQVPLANFEVVQLCCCQSPASRVISKPMFSVDHTGYHSPVTGEWIGSKREHREDLARSDCRVLEAGETEAAAQRREADDRELDRRVEDTVEREVEQMSSTKREKLYNELVNNDLVVERR